MTLFDFFIEPLQYVFMKRALIACLALCLAGGPIGVILILKRMSLLGEALSHGVLPGIAISSLVFGLWWPGYIACAIVAGILIALSSRFIHTRTNFPEDVCFSGLYLVSMALGILILFWGKNSINIMHLLFGNILSVESTALFFIGSICSIVLILFMFAYRPIIYESFDPDYMRFLSSKRYIYQGIFLSIVVMLLVVASMTIGTLMALGVIIIPALTARLIIKNLFGMFIGSIFFGTTASYLGLICSYHFDWPSGPTIILCAGFLFALVFLGVTGILMSLFKVISRKGGFAKSL